jgi:hypothetical protein
MLLMVSLFLILLYTDSWLVISSISPSLVWILHILFIWLVSSCSLLILFIMLLFFVSFSISRARSSMAFISHYSLLLSYAPMLMQTGLGIPLTVALPHVIASYWVPLLSLGVARNSLLFLAPVLKVSTVLLPMPPLNSSGFVSS